MSGDWHADDGKPYDVWLAELEAKYGKNIAQVIADCPPPARKKTHQVRHSSGSRIVAVRGHREDRDAARSAVDFRHHQSRIGNGR